MHSPRDCALAFTFPLDLEEARAQASDPSHDFIQSFLASGAGTPEDVLWEDYARIAAFSREVLAEAEQRGVLVAADAGLSDWGRLVRQRRVCTLFAHWDQSAGEGCVEFADGRKTCGQLIDSLPADYAGILDLAVCRSIIAGQKIKRARPRATVITHRHESSVGPRAALYRQVLRVLDSDRTSYTDAWTRVNLAAMEM